MNQTEKRKMEHVKMALDEKSQYSATTLLEDVVLIHNSLPELDFEKIDTTTRFLGKSLKAPMIIVGMTGGFKKGGEINKGLAEVAEKYGIAFGLGSQRAMLEKLELWETYYVRDVAPTIPVIGNIGMAELKKYGREEIEGMVKKVEADALAIHLNPLQEMIQPEGERNFSGVLKKIEELAMEMDFPIIVKETGAGISTMVAHELREAGIEWVDVSGAGGTSWSKIEYMRGGRPEGFEEWGIPTALSILMCKDIVKVIASGGIRNGIDGGKALVLGAEMFGGAHPFLKAFLEGKLEEVVEKWIYQLKMVMLLTGSGSLSALKRRRYLLKGTLKTLAEQI